MRKAKGGKRSRAPSQAEVAAPDPLRLEVGREGDSWRVGSHKLDLYATGHTVEEAEDRAVQAIAKLAEGPSGLGTTVGALRKRRQRLRARLNIRRYVRPWERVTEEELEATTADMCASMAAYRPAFDSFRWPLGRRRSSAVLARLFHIGICRPDLRGADNFPEALRVAETWRGLSNFTKKADSREPTP